MEQAEKLKMCNNNEIQKIDRNVIKNAYKTYKSEAKNGDCHAQLKAAIFERGHYCNKMPCLNLKIHLELNRILPNADVNTLCEIGDFFNKYYRKRYLLFTKSFGNDAFKCYSMAADSGSAYAIGKVAWCYGLGIGVPFNRTKKEKCYAEALKRYKNLAEKGDAVAQKVVGDCYSIGWGTEIDNEQAYNWYLKSARQNYILAQSELVWCYMKGWGTLPDWKKAEYWCNKILSRDKENCYSVFGGYQNEPRSLGRYNIDYPNDIKCLLSSISSFRSDYELNVFANAYDKLGAMYETGGYGIVQNEDKALIYYKNALNICRYCDVYQNHFKELNYKLHPELKAQAEAEEAARLAAKQQDDGSLLGDLLEIAQDAIEISNTFKNWDWNKSANEPATSSTPTISQESTPAPNNEKKLTAAEIQERNKATILNHKKHIDALHGEAESICKICHGSLKCPKCYGNGKCQDCDNCYFVDGHGHKIGADFSHWEYHIKGYYCRFCKGTTIYDGTECDKCSEVITTPNGHKIGVDNKLWKNDSGVLCTSCHGTMKCSDCAGSGKCQNGTHYRKYNLKDATLSRE